MNSSHDTWSHWSVRCPRCSQAQNDDTIICGNCDHPNLVLHRAVHTYFDHPTQTNSSFRCSNCQSLQFIQCPDCGASISADLAGGWHPERKGGGCGKSCGCGCLVLVVAFVVLGYFENRDEARRQARPPAPTPAVQTSPAATPGGRPASPSFSPPPTPTPNKAKR